MNGISGLVRGPRSLIAVATIAATVGCSSAVSQQQEVQIGQQTAAQVNAQLPMLHDATIDGYVNSLGRSIASRTSRSDLDWNSPSSTPT